MALRARLTVVVAAGTLFASQVMTGMAQLLSGALAASLPLMCRRDVRAWVERRIATTVTAHRRTGRRRRCRRRVSPPRRYPVAEWCAPSVPGWWRPDSRSGRR
mgnify:CR=1 FL=1|jgi:hypothetical protein